MRFTKKARLFKSSAPQLFTMISKILGTTLAFHCIDHQLYNQYSTARHTSQNTINTTNYMSSVVTSTIDRKSYFYVYILHRT